jgi:VWFA-related protein
MTRIRVSLLLLACVPAMAGTALEPREPLERLEQQTRRVYVAAVDDKGGPVIDLTAADFTSKENGKARDIARVVPATGMMQIAILVDDNGTGLFRYGIAKFIDALMGKAEFSISTVSPQTIKLVDYTTSAKTLGEALTQITARPSSNDGGQLLDGIAETAGELDKRHAPRPVIVALTVGGNEHSTLPAHHVLDKLRMSGASLDVIMVVNTALRSQQPTTSAGALLGENMNLNEVIGDGPKQSGGHRDEIIAAAGITTGLEQLAEVLKRQYVIEYTLPEGVKPSERLSVTVKRKGVTLRAPTRIPDK